MDKKFFLEELFDELRSLSDQYDSDDNEIDVFVLKPNEVSVFAEDILKTVKKHLDKELVLVEDDDEDIEAEELDDLFWLDGDDELE